ncbi:hypothetical protein COY32_02655 [candidate division WWE3 bacterium CG_4_10_14_0_2_um_filter_41_14]|uniref:CBM-cenC domain-containing protein n=1 Tax=candidate division WWE3 bacterium CG_4_10_14_0_2_um_filter_41_14 TaxID=1975072 RepID=A0A2M7TJQ8_UNCKA|nr:MAG: hypothetical protein COY32_02655 [candidate division WWE3 bacterium CG_4_10_14_0_2_um_filter_41_14]
MDFVPTHDLFRLSILAKGININPEAYIDNVSIKESKNLIYNGDMEAQEKWANWSTPGVNEIVLDEGRNSFVTHVISGAGRTAGILQDKMEVLPGETYELSMDMKVGANFAMPMLNITKSLLYNKLADFENAAANLTTAEYGEWAHYSRTFTMPINYDPAKNVFRLSILAKAQAGNTPEFWVDNISIMKVL